MIHFGARIFPSQCQLEGPYSLLVSNLHREILKKSLVNPGCPSTGPECQTRQLLQNMHFISSINCARFETMPGFSPRLTVAAVPYHLLIRGPVGASASEHCGQRHHMCQSGRKKVGGVRSTPPAISQQSHVVWLPLAVPKNNTISTCGTDNTINKTLHSS